VDVIAKGGFKVYSFSISWSQIFLDGFGAEVNKEGIACFNNLIDTHLQKGYDHP
jgi:beta-glucosidase/6-phospho-beta-glucosidase/beta-galactosidase